MDSRRWKKTTELVVAGKGRGRGRQNRKAGKIDRNFDDFAVNLNADEIPISWTEKGLLRVGRGGEKDRRTGGQECCFPSINSTMESNERESSETGEVGVARRLLS